jgi:putative molybdopterin biosynthesis protein
VNTNDIQPTLLTVNQVCEILHISKLTLYRWVKRGKLKASKVGQKLLIEQAEVQKLLEEGKTK